jgi:hypothetical protein
VSATEFRFEGRRDRDTKVLYAVIAKDENGEDYLVGADLGFGPMPLVTSMESMLPAFESLGREHGQSMSEDVRLVKFSQREDVKDLRK